MLALLSIILIGCGDDDAGRPSATATPTSSATATATTASTATASPLPSVTRTAVDTPSPTPTPAPIACPDLVGMRIADASITAATIAAAAGDEPAYCQVAATLEPALTFELRLPEPWNHKLVFLGGAGYDGFIPTADPGRISPGVLRRGYATVGTDSGHRASPFDAAWALDDPVALELFAVSARHRVLASARAIILAHYAAPARRAYFEGHSSGGREALIAAQRHPDDFDGVIARAPALNFTALNLNGSRIAKQLFAAPGGFLPPVAMQAFSRLVLRQCDALDGLEDAIVSHGAACQVDPAVLRCPADGGDCLSDAQLDSVRAILADLTLEQPLANGVDGHPGYPPSGAEAAGNGWPLWITGPSRETPASLLFLLQDGFVRYFVAQDADTDSLTFDAAAHGARLQSLSTLLDATDPDLSTFTARGGKLILWHGWADYAISARSTERYYGALVERAGGSAQAEAFARFYLAPGVDHLGGGNGATIVDLLGALDAWVDGGVAPVDLIGYRSQANELQAFRPVCRYPTYARYRGTGATDDARSFECATP